MILLSLALAVALAPRITPAPLAAPVLEEKEGCPWCGSDPARLAAAGCVSHGPFPIGGTTSDELGKRLPGNPWIFLDTAHFCFASNLGPEPLNAQERKQLEPELAKLRALLPSVPAKLKQLDPWLRLHLLAMRSEEFYARFQRLLGVTDADFPEARAAGGPFMGDGRFLGEKHKFQVLFHSRRETHRLFTREAVGVEVTDALRWHLPEHAMMASIPAEDDDLSETRWLFAHAVHIYSHLFLCAYKHFSYDPPIWLDEGLAHAMEREIEPLATTMDGDEGAGPHRGNREDWSKLDRELVARGQAPALAELMRITSFSDMSLDAHVTARSMVLFLAERHPKALAAFLGAIKGQLDERGYPTGRDLLELQRVKLQELFGWTVAELDEAWKSWVRARE